MTNGETLDRRLVVPRLLDLDADFVPANEDAVDASFLADLVQRARDLSARLAAPGLANYRSDPDLRRAAAAATWIVESVASAFEARDVDALRAIEKACPGGGADPRKIYEEVSAALLDAISAGRESLRGTRDGEIAKAILHSLHWDPRLAVVADWVREARPNVYVDSVSSLRLHEIDSDLCPHDSDEPGRGSEDPRVPALAKAISARVNGESPPGGMTKVSNSQDFAIGRAALAWLGVDAGKRGRVFEKA